MDYAPEGRFPAVASLHHGKLRVVVDRERSVIGVDVGGTKVAAALLRARPPVPGARSFTPRETPRVETRFTSPTDVSSPEACLDSIFACIERVAACGPVDAVGVGVASMVDFRGGRVVESVNLPLSDVPLRDLLAERLGAPAVIDNDANVAALAEALYGAGAGSREMLMLTLGTGVGGGIVCDGHLYRGLSGAAAELGHIVIDVNGPPCPAACPGRGCLEAFVAGPAMTAAAVAAARDRPQSGLGLAFASGRKVDGALLTRLGLEGDPVAVDTLAGIGELLGAGLVTLVNVFNPEVVVIGGGAAASGDLLLDPARGVLARRGLRPQRDQVRVVPAALGPDAGFVGAGALALVELLSGEAGGRS
jgi:glucokinase